MAANTRGISAKQPALYQLPVLLACLLPLLPVQSLQGPPRQHCMPRTWLQGGEARWRSKVAKQGGEPYLTPATLHQPDSTPGAGADASSIEPHVCCATHA